MKDHAGTSVVYDAKCGDFTVRRLAISPASYDDEDDAEAELMVFRAMEPATERCEGR